MRRTLLACVVLVLAACGQPEAANGQADARGPAPGPDHGAILAALNLSADAAGLVENECGERVEPQFKQVELGGAVGQATLLVMTGGPNSISCYGDGPGLTLLAHAGDAWRAIYSSRGGFLAVMPTKTQDVADIAFAGPGFEHPLWVWNGSEYVAADRSVADAAMNDATLLP